MLCIDENVDCRLNWACILHRENEANLEKAVQEYMQMVHTHTHRERGGEGGRAIIFPVFLLFSVKQCDDV